MKVAVVTNADERCGNAEYGRYLCNELGKYYEVESMLPFPAKKYDAALINWCPAVVHFTLDDLHYARNLGMKVLLVIQQSFTTPHSVDMTDTLCLVDAVTAHETMDIRPIRGAKVNFRVIPHGIVEVNDLPKYEVNEKPKIGTAGFGFFSKKMDVTVKTATALGGSSLVVAPGHPWQEGGSAQSLWDGLKRVSSAPIELVTDFLPVQEVIRRLATCDMNVYMADEPNSGQSGSARMLLSSRRPTILIRSAKTRQLFDYEDEIYFVSNEYEVVPVAAGIWSSLKNGAPVKIPNRVIQDCGWTHTGQMYKELLGEIVDSRSN